MSATWSSAQHQHGLSGSQIEELINTIHDWQYLHGSLLKFPPKSGMSLAQPVGATLFPSYFPKPCYEYVQKVQTTFNKLYASVSVDEKFLFGSLKGLIQNESSMARILWDIHCAIKEVGYTQRTSLGIFRSDYMLHVQNSSDTPPTVVFPKQVEFNTFSVAGGSHGNKISDMHRYLYKIGAYGHSREFHLPHNFTIKSISTGIATAHAHYGKPRASRARRTAVLMTVQPNNVNVCDERPIQEALWEQDIPCYRVEFGDAILASTHLTPSAELLYQPSDSDPDELVEVSVVYHRAGYDVEEYDEVGLETRYQLEKSSAIKCPSILGHLATLKIVQQKLAIPGVLEQYLDAEEAHLVRDTFMPMYPLDDSKLGERGRQIALSSESASKHVLKPSLEGGGHNVYRADIPSFLQDLSPERWADYILMEMIESPEATAHLISRKGFYHGPIISELGIFGACMWRQNENLEILLNEMGSSSLKTKSIEVDEMSVVKGYGCFDSPCF